MNALSSSEIFEASITKAIDEVIKKNSVRVFEKALSFIKDTGKKAKVNYGFAFKKYIEKAYEKYSKVKTILCSDEPQDLYSIYEYCDLKLKNNVFSCKDVDNLLNKSRYSIIQGTGGIGKSTMLKHFFLNELLKEDLIPIFIELKAYNNDETLIECMYRSMNNLGFSLQIEYFEYALKAGYFLILFDGYDEMDSDLTLKFNREFNDFCDMYDNNYFILTSRPQEDNFVSWNRFTVYKSQPLTKDQALNLIKKLDYDEETKVKFLLKLESELYDKHTSFASNPLLLNIMLLTFNSYADIPSKLHIFYNNAFETLFNKHDATKGTFKRKIKSNLSSDVFSKIFSAFCFRTYYNNEIEFSVQTLKNHLKVINEGLEKSEKFNIDNFIDDLENAVCLIYKDGRSYKFTHRSFQEYFVAIFLSNQIDEKASKFSKLLVEKDLGRLSNDSTFQMMFDINQEKFEKCVVLQKLNEIEEDICIDGNRSYEKYFNYFCVDMRILTRKDNFYLILDTDLQDKRKKHNLSFCLMLDSIYYNSKKGYYREYFSPSKQVFEQMRNVSETRSSILKENIINSDNPLYVFLRKQSAFSEFVKLIYNLKDDIERRLSNDLTGFDDLFKTH